MTGNITQVGKPAIRQTGKSNATRICGKPCDFCPEGTTENSPAFQRWVWGGGENSPEGTAETVDFSRPFGTYFQRISIPALKRWAILKHPSGMRRLKS